MMDNITIIGGSHDHEMKLIINNYPPGIKIDHDLILSDLQRRRPRYKFDTPRIEKDEYTISNGFVDGYSTGEDVVVTVKNNNIRKSDYDDIKHVFRPSHADYTWYLKHNYFIPPGGGPFSARITVLYVIAGAFAKMAMKHLNITFKTWVYAVGDICSDVYCKDITKRMETLLTKLRDEGDTIGGKVRCIVSNMPSGLGDYNDKFHAKLAYNIMTIPAVRAFEIGCGTNAANMLGSNHNDPYIFNRDTLFLKPAKNDAGGVLGGITTGEDLLFTVTFKPISSIAKTQETIDIYGDKVQLEIKGRHDICAAIRAVVIVEAIAALTLFEFINKISIKKT